MATASCWKESTTPCHRKTESGQRVLVGLRTAAAGPVATSCPRAGVRSPRRCRSSASWRRGGSTGSCVRRAGSTSCWARCDRQTVHSKRERLLTSPLAPELRETTPPPQHSHTHKTSRAKSKRVQRRHMHMRMICQQPSSAGTVPQARVLPPPSEPSSGSSSANRRRLQRPPHARPPQWARRSACDPCAWAWACRPWD